MQFEGTINYHNIFEPTFLNITAQDGKNIQFQPAELNRWFEHHMIDFPDNGETKTYKLTSSDDTISFHYIVNPSISDIIVPPNSIEMEYTQKNKWISDLIQRFFELIAYKHGYRLLVAITPNSAAAFNNRVLNILRTIGYYMGPPTDKAEVYIGEHQSTYTWNGIPEVWTDPEYMIRPIIGQSL